MCYITAMQYQLSLSISLSSTFKSKCPPFSWTHSQSTTPLIHCSVNYFLIEMAPLFDQSLFEKVDVTDLYKITETRSKNRHSAR